MGRRDMAAQSVDSSYGVSGWHVKAVSDSALSGLWRWFALPVRPSGAAVGDHDSFFGGTGFMSELAALEAGIDGLVRRGLTNRNPKAQ